MQSALKTKGVIVIGPAWHSCGSHQLFKAQLDAYASFGCETYFLAVTPTLTIGESYWDYYLRMTPDIKATGRGIAKMNKRSKLTPTYFKGLLATWNRTVCYWRTMPSRLATLPDSLAEFVASHDINIIHCNHYFNLPIAEKLKAQTGAKIVCETQDIQSRHFILSDPKHPHSRKPGTFDQYFADEINCSKIADEFIHLNEEECNVFKKALPEKIHHLVYPSVKRPEHNPTPDLDIDFLLVASANLPNYHSLCWFLDEVWDEELNAKAKLRIVGNIDYMFQGTANDKYKRFGEILVGRVEDVADWYNRARVILAPAIEGQGISMKTVEALSYGLPFIYSPLAVRGFADEPDVMGLPILCTTAAEFKLEVQKHCGAAFKAKAAKKNIPALNLFEKLFSPEAHRASLAKIYRML
jgi:polysaccharide biosynthesis protein PslH